MSTTRVLVIDDSAVMRKILTKILDQDPDLDVIATASNAEFAQQKIDKLKPDVITLDVNMPGMDGLTFLEKLMKTQPMPVVMVSSATEENCEITLRALELGAIDFVCKPRAGIDATLEEQADEMIYKVKHAASANIAARRRPTSARPSSTTTTTSTSARPASSFSRGGGGTAVAPARASKDTAITGAAPALIAIGTSTGGADALPTVLSALPAQTPPIVAVIHMPAQFTNSFAKRIDRNSQITVEEAWHGAPLRKNHAFIAPGDQHMKVAKVNGKYEVLLNQEPKVNRHRPAVDVLFESVAELYGKAAAGVILTGMGNDGAKGLLAMRNTGSPTIGQDEASSVVYGMPRIAQEAGAVQTQLPLDKIAPRLARMLRKQ